MTNQMISHQGFVLTKFGCFLIWRSGFYDLKRQKEVARGINSSIVMCDSKVAFLVRLQGELGVQQWQRCGLPQVNFRYPCSFVIHSCFIWSSAFHCIVPTLNALIRLRKLHKTDKTKQSRRKEQWFIKHKTTGFQCLN